MEQEEKNVGKIQTDGIFALLFLFLGWFYWEAVLNFKNYYGITVFTVVFTGTVLLYFYFSNIRPGKSSWFWFGVTLVLGASFSLPYAVSLLGILQILALHVAAVYWVLSATGNLMEGKKTSNWILFDLVKAVFVFPWGNFWRLPSVLFQWIKKGTGKKGSGRKKTVLAAVSGIVIAVLCLSVVLPLLFKADQEFYVLYQSLFSGMNQWFRSLAAKFNIWEFLSFKLPTALFMYGLVYGCIHGRRKEVLKKEDLQRAGQKARIMPGTTVAIVLFTLCGVYFLFIGMQINYFFGAFAGNLPAGFSYAEYARSGFFELCRIAAINLVILLAADGMSVKRFRENRILRICNMLLSLLTLLLLITASAKMGLYIVTYGLTVKRVLASVFMLWIAAVFVMVAVLQLKEIPILKTAVFLGILLFALLCVLPVEQGIESYNDSFEHCEDIGY